MNVIRKTLLGTSMATLSLLALTGQAQAGVLSTGTTFSVSLECDNDNVGLNVNGTDAYHTTDSNTGWQYATNNTNNGADGSYGFGGPNGVNPYQIRGIGVLETATSIIVALNANMPLTGYADADAPGVTGGQIGWGDLFFNFQGQTFDQAEAAGNLFGVRFASANADNAQNGNNPNLGVGLYSDVTTQSLTGQKDGYTTAYGGITRYENDVKGWAGTGSSNSSLNPDGTVNFGDLSDTYYNNNGQDNTFSQNGISTGTFLSTISFLSTGSLTQALLNTGYNSSLFTGTNTIAFEFDKSTLPGGQSVAAPTDTENPVSNSAVPEPTTIAGMFLGGLFLKMKRDRKMAH